MRSAKTPRLHEPLARHKLDLTPLHPTTKDGEWVAFAIGDLGWLAGCTTCGGRDETQVGVIWYVAWRLHEAQVGSTGIRPLRPAR